MIIQCRQCSAKFRFDDALMRPEGIWVRCSLCQYEFYQGHPAASPAGPPAGMPDVEEVQIASEENLPRVQPGEGADTEPVIEDDIRHMEAAAVADSRKRPSPVRLKIGGYALALLMILAGAAFLAFPEIGRQVVSPWSAYLPWIEKEAPKRPSLGAGIRIEGVKQRFVANMASGNLRVVEGVAFNESGQDLGRLQMKVTLVDSRNNWLGEKRAYAGRMLSDEELTTLSEEDMNRRMTGPGESAASDDRILPGVSIPFMIVWAAEPPGGVKTFVSVAAVERLPQ
jgi:predicted Zn finger-like uncharacterized protein